MCSIPWFGIILVPSCLPFGVATKATAAHLHGQPGRAERRNTDLLPRPAKGGWSSLKAWTNLSRSAIDRVSHQTTRAAGSRRTKAPVRRWRRVFLTYLIQAAI